MEDDSGASGLDHHIASELTSVLGSSVTVGTRTAWGFKNETWDVSLDDGQRVIVQVFRHPDETRRRVGIMRQLDRHIGLPIPRPLIESLDPARTWAAYVRLEGEPGYEQAGWDLSDSAWPAMAGAMGSVVRLVQSVPPTAVDLPDLWGHPEALAEEALRWAADIRPHCGSATNASVDGLIHEVTDVLGPFAPVVCHGDLGPQNVLFTGTTVTGVIDFEDARLGHPLLDVAWWNWLVRAHTPSAFERSWKPFLEGAGVDGSLDGFDRRVHLLIVLRLLETADAFRRTQPEKHASWGTRIDEEIASHTPCR